MNREGQTPWNELIQQARHLACDCVSPENHQTGNAACMVSQLLAALERAQWTEGRRCTCSAPSFAHQEHDAKCPKADEEARLADLLKPLDVIDDRPKEPDLEAESGAEELRPLADLVIERTEGRPPADGCINCGDANDGGYMTGFEGRIDEGAVGPFCSQCWQLAQDFFRADLQSQIETLTAERDEIRRAHVGALAHQRTLKADIERYKQLAAGGRSEGRATSKDDDGRS